MEERQFIAILDYFEDMPDHRQKGPANFVTLKHITQNMLKSIPEKMSMRVRRKRAGWNDDFLKLALMATVA